MEDVVSWLPGGKGFCIHNHELFCSKVLKATFNHSNYKSFEKQLNNWNFKREVNDSSKAYSNPNFMRGRKSLCQNMTSKSTRTSKPQRSSNNYNNNNKRTSTTDESNKEALAAALYAVHRHQQQQARTSGGIQSIPSIDANGGANFDGVRARLVSANASSSPALGLSNEGSNSLSSLALLNALQNRMATPAPGAGTPSPADVLNHILIENQRAKQYQQQQQQAILEQLQKACQQQIRQQAVLAQILIAQHHHQQQQQNERLMNVSAEKSPTLEDDKEKAAALLALRVPR
jgi:hypothetical protein